MTVDNIMKERAPKLKKAKKPKKEQDLRPTHELKDEIRNLERSGKNNMYTRVQKKRLTRKERDAPM